jgi:hypothetical protein
MAKRFATVMFIFFASSSSFAQIYDWEDFNKTVVALERISVKKQMSFLSSLCDDDFIHSPNFTRLFELLRDNNLNLGYTQVRCIKEFALKEPRDPAETPQTLIVTFLRGDNYAWYVESACLHNRVDTIVFQSRSFKPLAAEFNFSDFVNAVRNGEIKEFSGVAPFGSLPLDFFSGRRVEKTRPATIVITNLIFHAKVDTADFYKYHSDAAPLPRDMREIMDLGYVILKNTTFLQGRKKGWLLHEYGAMEEYYEKYMPRDVFHDFILDRAEGGEKARLNRYNLDKPSKFYFENIRAFKE